jgi:hypothetical protein
LVVGKRPLSRKEASVSSGGFRTVLTVEHQARLMAGAMHYNETLRYKASFKRHHARIVAERLLGKTSQKQSSKIIHAKMRHPIAKIRN